MWSSKRGRAVSFFHALDTEFPPPPTHILSALKLLTFMDNYTVHERKFLPDFISVYTHIMFTFLEEMITEELVLVSINI